MISFRRLIALIQKEFKQIVRDPSSIAIAFVLPAILLFIFSYGVSLDARAIKIGLAIESMTPESRQLAASFIQSRYFDVRVGQDRREFIDDLEAGRIRGIVTIPADFSERLVRQPEQPPIQVIADGSETNTANYVLNYARGAWMVWATNHAKERGVDVQAPIQAHPRFWYNPELESRYFLLPGAIAIIMTLIGVLLTSLVVAREWERGTMEALMATPVSIPELLLGKFIPYFLLGMGSMLVCVWISISLFQIPLRGSMVGLGISTAVFLLVALGIGFLISTLVRNQFVAAQIAVISGYLPSMFLSGFLFPIESMPESIQWFTQIVPARYFVSSLQTLFLVGDVEPVLVANTLSLLVFAGVLWAITFLKSKKQLD